jgi:hypothetical protein
VRNTPATPADGAWSGFDYEVDLDGPTTYTATDGTTSASVMVDLSAEVSAPWLTHPGRPALNRPVAVEADTPTSTEPRAYAFDVIDRTAPVYVWGRRRMVTGTLRLRFDTSADLESLAGVLADGWPVLIRYPRSSFYPSRWILPGRAAVDRIAPNAEPGFLTIDYAQVSAPESGTAGDPSWTYGTLAATFATYADVPDTFPTYRDLTANLPPDTSEPVGRIGT